MDDFESAKRTMIQNRQILTVVNSEQSVAHSYLTYIHNMTMDTYMGNIILHIFIKNINIVLESNSQVENVCVVSIIVVF